MTSIRTDIPPPSGPSLETYVETRFNLLDKSITEKLAAQDLRYDQRFQAQNKALEAAFLSQQQANTVAFTAAEKAVQAALAAADRAVSKAELASDKRFEALNELRQMLNDMVSTLITRVEAIQRFDSTSSKLDETNERVKALELRLNTVVSSTSGGNASRDDSRANLAALVAFVGIVLALITFFTR